MTDNAGTKEMTKEVQEAVVKRELINSTSNLRLTPGMRRALQDRAKQVERKERAN